MLSVRTILALSSPCSRLFTCRFSRQKFKIIKNPREISKLVFDQNGLCKIYEHKGGEQTVRKLCRIIAGLTTVNGILFGLEVATPLFGFLSMVSFGLTTGLGYFLLGSLQMFSRRIIFKIYLHNDFQTLTITFFNAFWKPQTAIFNISEFQDPFPSAAGYTKFNLTKMGKIWIDIGKNEFFSVKQYEQTLEHVLLGKPLTNLDLINLKQKNRPKV